MNLKIIIVFGLLLLLLGALVVVKLPEVQASKGTIKITSSPLKADVYMDGKSIGKTPVSAKTSVGKHSVIISRKGYYLYKTTAKVSANKTTTINAKLKSYPLGRYLPPGEYSGIIGCKPFLGNAESPLKIMFVNIQDAPHYEELVDDIIHNQLEAISPFKENFNSISFYSINVNDSDLECGDYTSESGSIEFFCDEDKLYEKITQQCSFIDKRGIIIIYLTESLLGGGSGEMINIGSSQTNSSDEQLELSKNIGIHEIGHNFGLMDLYYGYFNFDGSPSGTQEGGEITRKYLNVDGPGCEKWCESYKPVSEYTESVASQCLKFLKKEDCTSFERDSERSCKQPDCCVWSDDKFEYFNTNCVPALGVENTGINCIGDSGCYFGALGNYAWRPVLELDQSIMGSLAATKFDAVSEREITKAFECCLSENSFNDECEEFREDYADFLENYNFKKRIGSCGYIK